MTLDDLLAIEEIKDLRHSYAAYLDSKNIDALTNYLPTMRSASLVRMAFGVVAIGYGRITRRWSLSSASSSRRCTS